MWRRSQKTSTRRRLGPGEVVVPHVVSVPIAPSANDDRRGDDVLDAVEAVEVGVMRAHPRDVADEEAEHVDVVDAVLEQRAGADERLVAAPRADV